MSLNRIVKNYIYNVLYNLSALLIPLLTAPYLARKLGADMLGIFSYIQSTTAILCTVSMLGTYTFGNRQVAYTRDDKKLMSQEFCNIMGLRMVLGLIGTAVYIVIGFSSEYWRYFLLYYIYYLGYILDCSWLFVGVEDMKVCTLKNFLAKIGSAICIFAFIRSERDFVQYVLILALATFLSNVSVYAQIKKYVNLCKIQMSSLIPNLKAAFQLCLPTLVATVYLQVDKLMIEWITGNSSELAYYDQAEKIIMIPLAFITVLSTVMMPRIANDFHNGQQEQIKRLITKACSYSMMLACPLMFGMAGIATHFVPWYLGDDFGPVSYAIITLVPYVITNTLLGISGGQYFMATNQISVLLKSNIVGMVANVVVNSIMIPLWGYLGAAVATVIAQFLMMGFQYYQMNKQIPIVKTLLWQTRYLAYGALMFIAVWFVGYKQPASVGVTVAQIGVGVVVYFTLLLIARDPQLKEIWNMLLSNIKRPNSKE